MGARAMEWTLAIEAFLADGEWHATADALAAGAAVVPAERALREMGEKKANASDEERLKIGKRNVAQQGLTGLIRFAKVEYGEGRSKIRKVSDRSFSMGDFIQLQSQVAELATTLAQVVGQLDSMQTQLDRLDDDQPSASENYLHAAGLGGSSQ